jgi:hypothetical protein
MKTAGRRESAMRAGKLGLFRIAGLAIEARSGEIAPRLLTRFAFAPAGC